MPRKEKCRTKCKKLDTAAHETSSLGCDAADSNISNPQTLSDNVFIKLLQCVTLTGLVENFETEFVIDSGAGITIMSLDLINKYARKPLELSNNSVFAKTATGGSLNILGTTCVELDVGESKWFVDCYVARNFHYSFLLGTDFLIKTGVSIDLINLQATIGQHKVPISVVKRPSQVQVCVVESLEIPACSEALLTGRISGLQGTVLVEPKYEISSNNSLLHPARSVDYVKDNHIPVKVFNANDFPVKIFKGTCVGMAETLEEGQIDDNIGELNSQSTSNSNSWIDDIDLTNCSISPQEKDELLRLLNEYSDVFVKSDKEFGRAHRFTHNIDTGDNPPFYHRPYGIPHSQLGMVDEHIDCMLDKGIIRESTSPWSQPLVIVTKKDGSPRFCVNFRRLNSITKKQIFPMPRVDDVLDSLSDACYFTTLDLASGYWQIPMTPEDMEKTAFCTRKGNFEFRLMPMGLINASYTFQKMMQLVLSGLQWQICMLYLDDVIVYPKSFKKNLQNLRSVMDRFRTEGLKLKPKKCHFCKPEVLNLGHVVGKDGIKPNPDKVETIKNHPVPKNCNEVRSFVALMSYYRRFVKGFASSGAEKLQ